MQHTPARQKLTAKKRASFLEALATCGVVTKAAEAVGYTRQFMYELRAKDDAFAQAWDDALEQAADRLEAEARRRAEEGVLEPVVSMGKVVRNDDGTPMMVRKYSDSLTQFLLKGMRPEKYRENLKVSGGIIHALIPAGEARVLADELLDAVRDIPEARAALAQKLLTTVNDGD